MTLRLACLALTLGACTRSQDPSRQGSRSGWLHEVAQPVELRVATDCERAAARAPGESEHDGGDGIARTLELDLDGDALGERLVIAIRRETVVAITSRDCSLRWRGVVDDRGDLRGPSAAGEPWSAVSAREIARLYATDQLPAGATMQLWIVRGTGSHRHALLLRVGSTGALRYGWRGLVLSCHAGRCRGDAIGHHEWAPIPRTHGCGETWRTNRAPPHIEDPMLRVEPGVAGGSLVLTPHARGRDTCDHRTRETVRALAPWRLPPDASSAPND